MDGWIYRQTEREIERQAGRKIDRDRQTDR
jgi:hypothetical protein